MQEFTDPFDFFLTSTSLHSFSAFFVSEFFRSIFCSRRLFIAQLIAVKYTRKRQNKNKRRKDRSAQALRSTAAMHFVAERIHNEYGKDSFSIHIPTMLFNIHNYSRFTLTCECSQTHIFIRLPCDQFYFSSLFDIFFLSRQYLYFTSK